MEFNEKVGRKFCRGTLIEKIDAKKTRAKIETIDIEVVDRVNSRVLIAVRQHEIERCNGLELAAQRYTH